MVIGLSDTIYQLFYLSKYVMSLYRLGQGARSSRKLGELDFFPCVGIHWIALAKYSKVSTEFQSFLYSFFCIILYWPNKPTAAY